MAISPDRDRPRDGSAEEGEEAPDRGDEAGAEEHAEHGSSGGAPDILRDHAVHIAVIVAFAVYPLLYTQLMATPFAEELNIFLPRTRTMVAVLYVGLFAMSFDFISGYTGYLSFGHAMFYGIGAYVVVLAAPSNDKLPLLPDGTPLLVLLLVGALIAVVAALVVGAVSFRLTGVYFAMITLGFAEVAHVFIRNWDYISSNPRDGAAFIEAYSIGVPGVFTVKIGQIVGDEFPNLFGTGIGLSRADVSFYAIGVVVLVCYFAMQRIIHSPFGRVMVAIRENEERARAIGYNTFYYKMGAFAISAFFAAIAGGLFAGYKRSVRPENSFDLFVTADALLAAIIGGFGTLAGGLYGVLFHDALEGILSTEGHGLAPYLRRNLPESTMNGPVGEGIDLLLNGRASLYIGLVFILFVLYVPNGILGTLRQRLGGTVADRLPAHVQRYRRGGNG